MTTRGSRIGLRLVALVAVLAITEHRLTENGFQVVEDPIPELWEEVPHPGWESAPAVEQRSEDGTVTAARSAAQELNCAILLSLDRSSPHRLTSVANGVHFDIDADGDLDRVSWTDAASDVAFLAMDRDGDGKITSGTELIGGHTLPDARNGLSALVTLAARAVGGERTALLDGDHPLFLALSLWTDANHNGISEEAELRPAHEVISTIGLGYRRHHRRDQYGNQSRYRGFVHVRTAPGLNRAMTPEEEIARTRPVYDVCFVAP